MTTLAILALRVSVILLAALAACVACRRHSAALRHTVLAAGVVAALLVPPLTAVMPSWDVLPSPATAWQSPAADGEPVAGEPLTVAVRAGVAGVTASKDSVQAGPVVGVLTIERAVVGLWLLGTLIGAGILLTGLIRLARFSSRAAPLADERWLSASARVARQLGLSRPVQMLTTPDAAICTWGLRRPSIVVPAHAMEWPDERIATVLGHELAHVSRGDWALHLAAAVLRAVFWFNPLTWFVHRRLRDEAERACDDTVLRLGTAETAYAEHLLEIARSTRVRTVAFTAAMSMARSSTLEGRVAAMLNTKASRTVPSLGTRAAILAALVAAACGVATLGLTAQGGPLSLHGSVYDSTGAVLPAVEMALTNDRGIKWTTVTDGEGRFEFDPVGPGEYEFEATMAGFTSYKKKVTLDGPKDWNRIITLQVGNLEETITATAQRPKQVAAPVAASGTRVRVGGNIKPPTKTDDVRPVYPESMRAAGLEGTVPLEVVIGKDGKVIFARVVSAQVHPEFAKAAIAAVEQWTFTPTLLNGVPVEVTMTASVSFRLVD
jgi:TonB family protein